MNQELPEVVEMYQKSDEVHSCPDCGELTPPGWVKCANCTHLIADSPNCPHVSSRCNALDCHVADVGKEEWPEISHWDYRIVKVPLCADEDYYSYEVFEVTYDPNNTPILRTCRPQTPYGETLEELKADFERFKLAFKKDVLEDNVFGED